jgi:phosphoribosylformylglycinamidine synthase
MSSEDLVFIQEHFKKDEKRDPSMTELKVIDTYWSDHCRHTTFNTELTDITFEDSTYGKLVKKAFNEYLEMREKVCAPLHKPGQSVKVFCCRVFGQGPRLRERDFKEGYPALRAPKVSEIR